MMGWWIIVDGQTPEQRDSPERDEATLLATWESSVGGTDWLDQLVEQGKAVHLSRGGYPDRYTALAGDVLPLLRDGVPDHAGMTIIGDDDVTPAGWKGKITLHRDRMDACPSDQMLTIDAWDQS
jgi:hypothetical protein